MAGKKQVNKSAVNGQFVSNKKIEASPNTTYQQTVSTGKPKRK